MWIWLEILLLFRTVNRVGLNMPKAVDLESPLPGSSSSQTWAHAPQKLPRAMNQRMTCRRDQILDPGGLWETWDTLNIRENLCGFCSSREGGRAMCQHDINTLFLISTPSVKLHINIWSSSHVGCAKQNDENNDMPKTRRLAGSPILPRFLNRRWRSAYILPFPGWMKAHDRAARPPHGELMIRSWNVGWLDFDCFLRTSLS